MGEMNICKCGCMLIGEDIICPVCGELNICCTDNIDNDFFEENKDNEY
jgi:hypothetical protein